MQFNINPFTLCINNQNIISNQALDIIRNRRIELMLDAEVFKKDDDAPSTSTVVLLHGNSSSKKVFKEQAEFYKAIGFKVVTIDLLGHGRSSKISDMTCLNSQEKNILAEAFYNPIALIAEIKQFLSDLNIEHANLIGWSLGGHILYGVAIEQPNLVASITTIGSPPIVFNNAGLRKGFHPFFLEFVEQWKTNPVCFTRANAEALVKDGWGYDTIDPSNQFMVDDLVNTDPLLRKYLFLNIDSYNIPALNEEWFIRYTPIPIYLIAAKNDKGINADYYKPFIGQLKHPLSKIVLKDKGGHTLMKSYVISISDWFRQLHGEVAKVPDPVSIPTAPRL